MTTASPRSGFRTLLLRRRGCCFYSVLFARAHAGKSEYPAGKTLFVVNVPHAASEGSLSAAFGHLGQVASVSFGCLPPERAGELSSAPSGARTAHIVFEQAGSLKKALSTRRPLQLVEQHAAPSAADAAPSREELQRSVDSFMRKFEEQEARRLKEEERAHNQMDADGCFAIPRARPLS